MTEYEVHAILKHILVKSFHIMHFNMVKNLWFKYKFFVSERPEHLGELVIFPIPNNIPFFTTAQPNNSKSDIWPNKGGKLTKPYITDQ